RGASPTVVAGRLRSLLGPTVTVRDIDETRTVVGSSLTAVDLAGLTKVELAYALALLAGATGLALWLGFAQRRRAGAIMAAMGARPPQLAAFARAEAATFGVLGGLLGAVGGWALTHMLVKVLTGVFDPPPASLTVPWAYLGALALIGFLALAAAVAVHLRL